MAGNYILAIACMMLARIQNDEVTVTISQVNYSDMCKILQKGLYNLGYTCLVNIFLVKVNIVHDIKILFRFIKDDLQTY